MRVGYRLAATVAAAASLVLVGTGLVSAAEPATATAAGSATLNVEHAKATFEGLCANCHDLGLVTAQGHDRSGWEEVVNRMYGFGLAGTDDEVKEVVEYLVATYPAEH